MRRQRNQQESYDDPFGDFSIKNNTKSSSSNHQSNNNNNNNNNNNSNHQHQHSNYSNHTYNHSASSYGSAGGISHSAEIDWTNVPKTVKINFIEKALLKDQQSQKKNSNNANNQSSSATNPFPNFKAQQNWRDENRITLHGIPENNNNNSSDEQEENPLTEILKPMTELAALRKIHFRVYEAFVKLGFSAPTPIQAQAWPLLFAGRDVIGIAKTGSGKTLAFAVPGVAHALAQQTEPLARGEGPLVLVLAPTRELALQIDVEARKLFTAMKEANLSNPTLRSLCIFGGVQRGQQLGSLQASPTFVVATPGRLLDLLNTRTVGLKRVVYLVLDEADRMLDMGFEPQIRDVLSFVRPDRQTLMFSATWPQEVQKLAMDFTSQDVPAIRVQVGSDELHANSDVTQHIMFLKGDSEKFAQLKLVMKRFPRKRALVFVKKRIDADELERKLNTGGYKAYSFHGDKEQSERMEVLSTFRKSQVGGVLVATDVASRGLDIQELDVVVNYDFPMTLEDYVHRIGRTGRAGASGDAFSFITKREEQLNPWVAEELVTLLKNAKQTVPADLKLWAADTMGQPKPDAAAMAKAARHQKLNSQLYYNQSNKPTDHSGKKGKGLDLGDLLSDGGGGGAGGKKKSGGGGLFGKSSSFDPFA